MRQVIIERKISTKKQTVGRLIYDGGNVGFSCDTLELPWKENEHDYSCIPTGIYPCKWTRSSRMSNLRGKDIFTYEVLNVPNRAGIRIHSASFFHDLLGCIALGEAKIDIDKDGQLDLINSRITVGNFNDLMNEEDFELIIK